MIEVSVVLRVGSEQSKSLARSPVEQFMTNRLESPARF